MSEIKLPDNYSDIVVMAAEPLKGYAPDCIREMMTRYKTDDAIATFMAMVANKTGWLGHDIGDPDNDAETDARIKAEHDAWWELEKELYAEIIRRLEEENRTQGTSHITSGIGLHYIIKPFMERNGYRNGAGWRVGKEVKEH